MKCSIFQAAVVYSCIWALGGCLATEDDRAVFDTGETFVQKQNINFFVFSHKGNHIW